MTRSNENSASFRQLLLFDAVARCGSVTHAARECGLSQPAATQALAVFRAASGFAIIEGQAKGTSLTARGRELHARIVPILARLQQVLSGLGVSNPAETLWRISQSALRNLDAIRERGSAHNAALALGLTRRSLDRSIKDLEALMHCKLVDIDGGIMVLTGNGVVLAQQSALAVGEIAFAIADVGKGADRDSRSVVIGVAPDPGTASLNRIVKGHLTQFPATCLEVIEQGQDDLLTRLLIGEIDLVIGHILDQQRGGVEWDHLATMTFRIVARKGHPLAALRQVPLRQLAEQNWILGARGSQRRAAADILFAGRPHPEVALVTAAAPMMAHVMADSDLIGLMTDQELVGRMETLAAIDHAVPGVKVRIGWARRTNWKPAPAALDLRERIVAHYGGSRSNG